MAYHPFPMDPGLPLYSIGWEPRVARAGLLYLDDDHAPGRPVARRSPDFHSLGRNSWAGLRLGKTPRISSNRSGPAFDPENRLVPRGPNDGFDGLDLFSLQKFGTGILLYKKHSDGRGRVGISPSNRSGFFIRAAGLPDAPAWFFGGTPMGGGAGNPGKR